MTSVEIGEWAGPDSEIGRTIAEVREQQLGAYRSAPKLVEEHANIERRAIEGGYGKRQLYELIQNGADELLGQDGRIEVVLAADALYCANEGRPLTQAGMGALLFSNLSAKTGSEIGRFGLGFKSVLGISHAPEILSRSGSVRFNPSVAREEIAKALGGPVDRVPTLRIAEALDPDVERAQDEHLAQLMSWATTVVRLRRDAEDTSWLGTGIIEFPAEFLLFSPHVSELVLRDRENGFERTVTAHTEGDNLVLREDARRSVWRVFTTLHTPTARARRDGGTMAARDEIPLAWAVNIENKQRKRGTFWAFFPTYERTTLSGVLNAPWKLTEDRARLIDNSPFNQELIEAACDMILEHLPDLTEGGDPGLLLDLMPARGKELAGWADGVVTEKINNDAAYVPSIPDQEGELELPSRITLHPAGVPREVLELWSQTPDRPTNWAHSSVEARERRPRVEIYLASSGGRTASTAEWLQAIVKGGRPETSRAAVQVAAALVRANPEHAEQIRNAAIVMDESGELVAPTPGEIFMRATLPVEAEARYVHPELASDNGTRRALETLGILRVDSYLLLEAHIEKWEVGWRAEQWDLFWSLVREIESPERVIRLLSETGLNTGKIAVRTRAGNYSRLISVLLPGDVASERTVEDAAAVIDVAFHAGELPLLRHLGAVPSPVSNAGRDDEPWFGAYKRAALEGYLDRLKGSGAAPNRDYLGFRERPFAGPGSPLMRELSADTRCRLTHALLQASSDLEPWTFCHLSQPARYPERQVPQPIIWLLQQKGLFRTSLGTAPIKLAVGPELEPFRAVLPVVQGVATTAARALGLPITTEQLSETHWKILFQRAGQVDDERTLAMAYVAASLAAIARPSVIRCRVGAAFDDREPSLVAVTADEDLADVFRRAGDPHLVVRSEADATRLVEQWGLRSGSDAVRSEIGFVPAGEEEPLIDLFPLLRYPLDDAKHGITVLPCSELRVETFTDAGKTSASKLLVAEGERIYRSVDLGDADFLHEVSSRLGLGLEDAQITAIIRNLEDRRVQKLRIAIRDAPDDRARLLLGIGADELRSRIPASLLEAASRIHGHQLSEEQIAELALAVYGVEALQQYREVLEERGLTPPRQWAGRRKAVQFVRELGFGPEYAGFERASLDPILEVEGTPDIPPLHDFQRVVVDEVRELLGGGGEGLRGLLSLPTGAGKTRVTVEALVDAMAEGRLSSPILWIAQTEELCEQAVQTWSEIWRGLGPRRRLTVSRLWGAFEASPADYGDQVVVATIAKLEAGVYAKASYDWLKANTTAIVVDEAHSSIGTAYTHMLAWQDMARNVDRVPLIGLTATPFRNTNVEETKRLAARYGGRRLDTRALGGADAYPRLQDLGILSHVDHRTLPGQDLELTDAELKRLQDTRMLPGRAALRLGENVDRNRTLLEDISSLDPSWPVLLFAASVEHAQIMAALLTREGIPAAAITGEMDRGARRHYIREFREDRLRVLTNFNVLTAGFDAPQVRALYIARPTYSPNAYQQMVGRGLRGPMNGGTDRCLLVNVEDNVLQFGDRLAFHEFDYLWNRNGDGAE